MSARTTRELSDGVIVGEYQLDALLGSGGMGQVYRARPMGGGDEVAIKILLKEHVENAGVVARFLREARAARVVEHPNVVKVIDIGRDAESRPFIVQELLRGEDLSKLLKVTRKLSPSLAVELLIPVGDAMAFAHERGVVHRDLKPGNIFITFVGGKRTPKVLDFGISHLMEADDGTRLTSTGMSLGTPAYMAPEQIMASKEIDARADVWSLGVILYQLVAGRLPFAKAESAGALYVQICTTEAPPLEKTVPGVPREYARIVARCLRPERKDRYPSAAELLVDLRKLQDDPAGAASRGVRSGMDRVLVETAEPGEKDVQGGGGEQGGADATVRVLGANQDPLALERRTN